MNDRYNSRTSGGNSSGLKRSFSKPKGFGTRSGSASRPSYASSSGGRTAGGKPSYSGSKSGGGRRFGRPSGGGAKRGPRKSTADISKFVRKASDQKLEVVAPVIKHVFADFNFSKELNASWILSNWLIILLSPFSFSNVTYFIILVFLF